MFPLQFPALRHLALPQLYERLRAGKLEGGFLGVRIAPVFAQKESGA